MIGIMLWAITVVIIVPGLTDTPVSTPTFAADDEPWLGPYTGPSRSDVDATTLPIANTAFYVLDPRRQLLPSKIPSAIERRLRRERVGADRSWPGEDNQRVDSD